MTDRCSICLDELLSDIGVAVPCGHAYHVKCFDTLRRTSREELIPTICCICKAQIEEFHSTYLCFNPRPEDHYLAMENRVKTLQLLSSDQSDLLCRILPRNDFLEKKYSKLKCEKRRVRTRLHNAQDENWELRLDNFDLEAKLARARADAENLRSQLEERDSENQDLHSIWETVEEQLAGTMRKLKERTKELKCLKKQMEAVKAQERPIRQEVLKNCPKKKAPPKPIRAKKKKKQQPRRPHHR